MRPVHFSILCDYSTGSLRVSKLGICRIPSACGIWLAFFGDSEVKTLKDQNTDADLRLATAFGSNHLDPS